MFNRNEYNKIYENAVQHIECAKLLSNEQMFWFAISHLILGIEELIKYQVVMTTEVNDYSFGDIIESKNRNSIFRNHLTKHDLAKKFQKATEGAFAKKFLEASFLKLSGQDLAKDYEEVLKNPFKEWGAFFAVTSKEMSFPDEERKVFFEWLEKANDTKNNGFYANVTGDSIDTPGTFSIEEYKKAERCASLLLRQTEFMKSVDLSDEEFDSLMKREVM